MASPFVPKGREELLLRTPLTFGFSAPSNMYQPRNSVSAEREDFSAGGSREQQRARIKKMSRNTPHTNRVKSMKGLTDDPICLVEDNQKPPRPMSALTNRDLSNGYRPPGSSRYSSNANKHLFAVGVVPVTYAWRDELIKKAQKAISKVLGEDDGRPGSRSSSRPQSRQTSRGLPQQFDHLDDQSLLDMMCQILHTTSIPHCKDWLNHAPEDEKDIVLNMIRLAALGEEGAESLPTRPASREHRYVWQPQQSRRHSDPFLEDSRVQLLSLSNTHPRYFFSQYPAAVGGGGGGGGVGGGGGMGESIKLPGIAQTPRELTKAELHKIKGGEEKGGRRSKLRRSLSHDAGSQTVEQEDLEADVYKSIAASTVLKQKHKKQEEGGKKRKQKSGSRDHSSDKGATVFPPLQQRKQHVLKQQRQQQQRPRSKSTSGAEATEHLVKGERREGVGSKMHFTSHWDS